MVEKGGKKEEKESKSASRPEMASMMHICSGLVGPNSENVEEPLVFKVFLKESKGARAFQECEKLVEKGGFGRKIGLKTRNKKKTKPLDMRWQA